LDKIYYLAFHS
jgi:hypothetical protein